MTEKDGKTVEEPTSTEEAIEIPDPGQEEGLSNKPALGGNGKDQEPEWHSQREKKKEERFQEFFAKAKRFDELHQNYEKLQENFTKLQSHNMEVMQAVNRLQERPKQQPAIPPTTTSTFASDIDTEIRKLQSEKRQARKDEDLDRVDEIENSIYELRQAKQDEFLKSFKDELSNSFTSTIQQQTVSSAVADFTQSTPWYNPGTATMKNPRYDPVMAAAAQGLESQYLQTIPDIKQRLQRVKMEIEERFKWTDGSQTPEPQLPVVNSGGDGSNLPSEEPDNVTVTPEVARIAAQFGMDPKDYQKQVSTIENARRSR
jgi:hypothetical protein